MELEIKPAKLAGDKGYRYDWIDDYLMDGRIEPVIPSKSNENCDTRPVEFDTSWYRRRSVVEQLIGCLNERRRVATRYEKLASRYPLMVKLSLCSELTKSGGDKQNKGKSPTHASSNRIAGVLRVCGQTLIWSMCVLGAFGRSIQRVHLLKGLRFAARGRPSAPSIDKRRLEDSIHFGQNPASIDIKNYSRKNA